MASLDDILTTQKNGVQALSNITNNTNRIAGNLQTREISSTSTNQLVKPTPGWLATVSVIAGGTSGYIYDTTSSTLTAGNRIYTIPATVGVYQIQMPFGFGLLVVPGSGQIVAVAYS